MSSIATLRLLGSSLIVAVSGGFRLHIAFLLAGKEANITLPLAAILIVYATYTLDRAIKTKEDEINRQEETNANKNLVLFLVCSFFLIAVLVLIKHRVFPLIAFFPLTMGFLYSKGIKIGKILLKLKGGMGAKNFVVAFTWAATTSAFVYPAESLQLLLIFIFFFIKSFINTVIFDCKDIEGDSSAGLITLPVHFGEAKTRAILQLLHSSFHLSVAILVILNIVKFEATILIYSWVGGMIYIIMCANSKKINFRSLVVHGEWVHMLAFRNLTIQLSRTAFHSS